MIIFSVAVGVAILNSFHVIIQWVNNKPGEVFTGISHSFADYFLYTAQMAQGVGGRWIWSDHLFTNEPMAPTWYYWFNVALGHLGSLVGLSPFATYNVSLIFLVTLLCIVWYLLTKTLYPTNRFLRLTSWIMILTSTTFFSFARYYLAKLEFWFSPSPIFNRLGGVPYQVFQTILFLFLCMAFAKKSRLVPLLSFIAGLGNPIQMLLFVLASRSIPAAVFGGMGALLTREEFTRQAVFTAARSWELAQYVPNTLPTILLSFGPILFFVPFGIKGALRQGNQLCRFLIIWGALSFALFLTPIPRLLGLSPVRFLHPVPYASLAIVATRGLFQFPPLHRALLLGLYLIVTVPAIFGQLMDRSTPAKNPQLLMDTMYNHVPAPIVEALDWLKKQPHNEVVFVDPAIPIEVLVPAFTGKPSFSGHPIHTLYPNVKEELRQQFFRGTMPDPQTFLADHRIGYIISSRTLPLFKQVYKNDTIIIYTP